MRLKEGRIGDINIAKEALSALDQIWETASRKGADLRESSFSV